MADDADVPRVHAETRAEWRAWLAAHHAHARGAWLVSWRSGVGRPAVGYEDSVREALCFGWVDSKGRKLDEERSMLYFAPRRSRSGWARTNKQRVEQLRVVGLMTDAGEAVIAEAEANGSWSLLDEVENLTVPADLRKALDAHPPAGQHWQEFPPSARRAILEWIVQARTAPTRARRVAETARLAALNQRANQWRPRDAGPAAP
jgi:uncharacterized protein YdeI (YjbR/CyaY-like superfamily)